MYDTDKERIENYTPEERRQWMITKSKTDHSKRIVDIATRVIWVLFIGILITLAVFIILIKENGI